MDEAFTPLHRVIGGLGPTNDLTFTDEDAGVRMYVRRIEVEAPVELDVGRGDAGALEIGSTPPLYYADTSLRPSYHRLRFVAELESHGD